MNDGGPALPRDGRQRASGEVIESQDGMTLRDYFAGQALCSIPEHFGPDQGAKRAYLYADAMLRAREEMIKA